MTPELQRGLVEHKSEVVALLREVEFAQNSNVSSIKRSSARNNLPLSFAQQRLWFLNELEPNSPWYNIPAAIRLKGTLNIAALEAGLNEIVKRHEALRTIFQDGENGPVQTIISELNLKVKLKDLSELPATNREAEILRLVKDEARAPFNLSQGPLIRATLLELGEQERVLLINLHHIVSDGWSKGILIREFSALYDAFNRGRTSPLADLPIQYADFTIWQRQWLQGEVLDRQMAYWKEKLGGQLPILQLPTDRPRAAVQSHHGATDFFELSSGLTRKLREVSRRERMTLFITLLAAFKVLFFRYSGQDEIIIGSPIANRNRAEIEGLIGFFVNTLALRTDLSGSPTFVEMLGRVKETMMGAYAHQDLPFEMLVQELNVKRDLSTTPVFQVMVVLQNAPRGSIELPGVELNPLEVDSGTAKFDLTFNMTEADEALIGRVEYNKDLFDESTIKRMASHFETLLESVVSDPGQRISELSILTEGERHQILVDWNDTEALYPKEKCIHQLVEEQVQKTPDRIAVVFEDERLTYGELNGRANQVANYLRKHGVGPEVLVGICVERSIEMVVGLLGILKAGGAFVPLDPAYPKERLAFMLEDAGVKVLLTQERLLGELPEYAASVICLDGEWKEIAKENAGTLCSTALPDNLAYVIYTSGSTGRPKGIAIEHRALCNLIFWQTEKSEIESAASTLQFSSLSFDVSFQEIFSTWCVGGKIFLIDFGKTKDPFALLNFIQRNNISRIFLPSVALHSLSQSVSGQPKSLQCLQEIITAGEQLHLTPQLRNLIKRSTACVLHNQYGPSECHVVAAFTCAASLDDLSVFPPIGKPISNTKIYLLGKELNPVPIGVAGELYICGAGMSRGYLGRPEVTAEKFIPNPFSDKPGARLYRTGDLARYCSDGNLEFLGRIDHQVKIRGFRIELGEIEAALRSHSAVKECVAIAREDVLGDKRLVAYVVASTEYQRANMSEMKSYLKEMLPEYMVPSAFVFMEALPLDPNRKVNRKALPKPEQGRLAGDHGYISPRDEIELRLTRIWEKLLDVHPIGVNDDFFELGGHSLLAVRLAAAVQKEFQQLLPLSELIKGATIGNCAHILRQKQPELLERSSLVAIQPRGMRKPFFCVHPAGGNVLCYYELANNIGSEQPFYGLQARGITANHEPHIALEEMAADYLADVRSFQPEGPYSLGGWSYGSVVAFEMAQQLRRQGQEVGMLALIDPPEVGLSDGYRSKDDLEFIGNLAEIIASIYRIRIQVRKDELQHLTPKERIDYLVEKLRLADPHIPPDMIHHLMMEWRNNVSLLDRYRAKKYHGPITFFQASETRRGAMEMRGMSDLTRGWNKFTSDPLDVYVIPGNHWTIMAKPNLTILGDQLRTCLEIAHKNRLELESRKSIQTYKM